VLSGATTRARDSGRACCEDQVMPLPRPGDLGLPSIVAIVVPVPDNGLTLFRLMRGPDPRQEDFEPSFTRPQAQLRGILELFRTSVSHWLRPEQAGAWSKGRVYSVARLELRPDPLLRVALTERVGNGVRVGHVDVWAYPSVLLQAVVDVSEGRRLH
jgi:hypothetical protein